MTDPIEIRLNDDGTLDEVVSKDCFVHLEQMNRNIWWLGVYRGDERVCVWFRAKGKITANAYREKL